ncbi:MAG: ABC transporter permease, partial [Proteobacteria bacterium]|nr:ABC transporter permease [Pseudomonadota bacterium]
MNNKVVKIYRPDKQLEMGWISIWREMLIELINSRELIWRLFIRDFLAKYRQTILGVFWALLMPLALVGSFAFLNRAGILNIGKTNVPYPVFALLGLTIWQLFATGLVSCTNSIVQGGSMVAKINFPKESLVISSMAQSVFEFLVRIVLLIAVFVFYQVMPSRLTILFPLALLPLFFLTIGLGFIFSLLNAVMRDTANIITLLTMFFLFLTPVLYPAPESGLFAIFNQYNPLSPLISGPRDLVILG